VREQADCKFAVFNTHHIYPDHVMTSLAAACASVTGEGATKDHFMQFFGRCFVRFFSNFGYGYISQEEYTRKLSGHSILRAHGNCESYDSDNSVNSLFAYLFTCLLSSPKANEQVPVSVHNNLQIFSPLYITITIVYPPSNKRKGKCFSITIFTSLRQI
jgi:hypothetical protein